MIPSLSGYLDQLLQGWNDVQRWVGFWGPVIRVPFGLDPAALIGAMMAMVITTGIAVGALATLLISLLALYLLLTQVFGLRLELAVGGR